MRNAVNQKFCKVGSHMWIDEGKSFSTYAKLILMLAIVLVGFAFGEVVPRKTVAEIAAEHTLTGSQSSMVRTLDDKKYPYQVTSDYFVDSGRELIVKDGVTLIFAKNAGLSIQGALRMEGTPESPITCKGNTTGIGVWLGLRACSGGNVDIEGVSITGAKCAVRLDSNASIRKCYICRNDVGIECRAGDSTIEDCYICDNRSHAIIAAGTFIRRIDHCTIANNIGCGVSGWGACNMQASIIERNKDCGINCWNGGVVVNGSVIGNNKKFDLNNGCPATWDCTENYWGPAVTKMLEMKGDALNLPKILDRKDKPDNGSVNISKWLSEAPLDCGAREYPGKKTKKR